MKARVKWIEGLCFMGESESGHGLIIDGPPDAGGRNLGMRPMEMLLISMGSCSAIDVISMLKKSRQQVTDCAVELSASRAETYPKIFTHIHLHFVVVGKKLDAEQVGRAVNLSAEKYCSASIMLAKVAQVTHDFELITN